MSILRALLFTPLVCAFTFQVFADDNKIAINDESFGCLAEMTPVRGFFVDNLKGDVKATVAAATSNGASAYPAGSVVQLVPSEVMVKLNEGSSPATKDWEFLELSVSDKGSKIDKRGFVDVNNKFGGNCFACHAKAEPKWDMVCETGHGCDPLPLTKEMVAVIQKTDPRCETKPQLSAADLKILGQLQQLFPPQE